MDLLTAVMRKCDRWYEQDFEVSKFLNALRLSTREYRKKDLARQFQARIGSPVSPDRTSDFSRSPSPEVQENGAIRPETHPELPGVSPKDDDSGNSSRSASPPNTDDDKVSAKADEMFPVNEGLAHRHDSEDSYFSEDEDDDDEYDEESLLKILMTPWSAKSAFLQDVFAHLVNDAKLRGSAAGGTDAKDSQDVQGGQKSQGGADGCRTSEVEGTADAANNNPASERQPPPLSSGSSLDSAGRPTTNNSGELADNEEDSASAERSPPPAIPPRPDEVESLLDPLIQNSEPTTSRSLDANAGACRKKFGEQTSRSEPTYQSREQSPTPAIPPRPDAAKASSTQPQSSRTEDAGYRESSPQPPIPPRPDAAQLRRSTSTQPTSSRSEGANTQTTRRSDPVQTSRSEPGRAETPAAPHPLNDRKTNNSTASGSSHTPGSSGSFRQNMSGFASEQSNQEVDEDNHDNAPPGGASVGSTESASTAVASASWPLSLPTAPVKIKRVTRVPLSAIAEAQARCRAREPNYIHVFAPDVFPQDYVEDEFDDPHFILNSRETIETAAAKAQEPQQSLKSENARVVQQTESAATGVAAQPRESEQVDPSSQQSQGSVAQQPPVKQQNHTWRLPDDARSYDGF